jgi:hypothetical protein
MELLFMEPSPKRVCHNTEFDFYGRFFGGVKPLKNKNNALKAKIESLIFSLNNYDTASKARVSMKTIHITSDFWLNWQDVQG